MHEREALVGLVERAESPREEHDGVGFLHEQELAREEVPKRHELRIVGDELVRVLLEGQADVEAEAASASGAGLAGAHDAAARAGDDHEALVGDSPREFLGLPVAGVGLGGSRRAERGHLAHAAVGREDPERITQLAHRRVEQADVGDRRAVLQQADGRGHQLADVLRGGLGRVRADLAEKLLDASQSGGRTRPSSRGANRRARLLPCAHIDSSTRRRSSSHFVTGGEQV